MPVRVHVIAPADSEIRDDEEYASPRKSQCGFLEILVRASRQRAGEGRGLPGRSSRDRVREHAEESLFDVGGAGRVIRRIVPVLMVRLIS